jgi:capsular polysaccharide biosynthesis protein
MLTIPLKAISGARLSPDELRWGQQPGISEVFPSMTVRRRMGWEVISTDSPQKGEMLRQYFSDPSYQSACGSFAHLNDITVEGTLGVCTTSTGQVIKETAHVARMIDPTLKALANQAVADVVHSSVPVLHCFHRSAPAYGHFLFDCLSVILYFRDVIEAGRLKILFPSYFPTWGRDALKATGLDPDAHLVTFRSDFMRFDDIIIPETINTTNTFLPHPDLCQYLRNCAFRPCLPHSSGSGPHLYMSRRNQVTYSSRSIENEDAVRIALEQLGYCAIEPGNMPFAAQVAAMRGASVIIGAHGSSFGNLAFAPPGAASIDLMPQSWIHFWNMSGNAERWMLNLTSAFDLKYNVLLCQSEIREEREPDSDRMKRSIITVVDIEALKQVAGRALD